MAATKPKPEAGQILDPRPEQLPYPPTGYAWFVVIVLMIFYTFSFLDRTILNLMVEPIKRDLEINDTQMSILMGASFAILYSVLGVPFGRMADRYSRVWIIGGGLFVWTMMTAACGVARNYTHLLLGRIGVGVGEATLSPSAYSMVADYFPPSKLGKALSVYSMGIFIGAGLAMGVGGYVVQWTESIGDVTLPIIGQIYSWQVAFIIIGLIGLLPLLLLFAVKEPVRRGVKTITGADGKVRMETVSLRQFWNYQKGNGRTIVCHHLGAAALAFSSYGVGYWGPAFMIRIHDWSYQRIGFVFMFHVMIAGCAGVIAGGWLCDRLYKKGYTDAPLRIGLIGAIAWAPTGILYPLVDNGWLAWGLMVPTYFFATFPTGVLVAAIQTMNPNTMRATASAVYLLTANLIGQAAGPTGVALFTDYAFDDPMMLPYSMIIVGVICHVIAVVAFLLGLKPFRESVARAQAHSA